MRVQYVYSHNSSNIDIYDFNRSEGVVEHPLRHDLARRESAMRNIAPRMNRVLAAVLATMPLLAGAASGEFTFVTGEVTLVKPNGQRAAAAKGTPVDPGDRIITGANGMAQLTMVDNARLSLRPSTTFQIEAYPQQRDSADGAVLNLLRGTLRTFTGLLASTNRDKFVMKTRVATVGIRGSGNILYACEGQDCDEGVDKEAAQSTGGVTINHTIEGSHAITNIVPGREGLPAQQGGATTAITGPGQTVLVAGGQPPRYIPMPRFIGEAATNPAGGKQGAAEGNATGSAPRPAISRRATRQPCPHRSPARRQWSETMVSDSRATSMRSPTRCATLSTCRTS
jgi:hypothetical protein